MTSINTLQSCTPDRRTLHRSPARRRPASGGPLRPTPRWLPHSTTGFRGFGEYSEELETMSRRQ